VNESVHIYNPENGWLQNCNSTPFTAAGKYSPKKSDYVTYLAPDGENYRGVNAVRVLDLEKKYTLDKVIKAGYDKRLTAFEDLIPALVNAFEKTIHYNYSLFAYLAGPIAVLKNWDYNVAENSIATTLAIEWGQQMQREVMRSEGEDGVEKTRNFAKTGNQKIMLKTLLTTINDLQNKFGKWQMPWGDINRLQRISSDIENKFDDSKPSTPVAFASSAWGMLPSYNSRTFTGTKKRYGYNGNSFIAAVEFGKRIKAKSLLAVGQSGNLDSPHFKDQLAMYAKGEFKDVLFYKEDVLKKAEKTYHPGE
jgi:acyl-homoserine lactone acylase PvdQ